MSNYRFNLSNLIGFQPETIWLEPEHIQQASEISDRAVGEAHQWQTYLNALGLFAFENWLGNRRNNFSVNNNNCSLYYPNYANIIEAVCNVSLGQFQICLLATESLLDETVAVPRAAVDLQDFAADFYLLLEILEEQEQVMIRGMLRGDILMEYRQLLEIPAQPDWTYHLPLSLFDAEPNHLLFYSRFGEPTAIALPGLTQVVSPPLAAAELETLLLNWQSPNQRLWEFLTWEQGAAILTNPDLLQVYENHLQKFSDRGVARTITQTIAQTSQSWVNLKQWLNGQFTAGWGSVETLLTPLEPSFVRGGGEVQPTNPEAIASVIRLLQSDRPEETRCQAAGVLGEIGAGNPDATKALIDLLETARSEETRWQAALSLSKTDPGNSAAGVKKARLIDLGMELAGKSVALIVAIMPKPNDKIGVFLQVKPVGNLTKLPPQLKLAILSETGQTILEAESRSDEEGNGIDNAIERRFIPPSGIRFQVIISLNNVSVTEDFLT